MSAIDNRQICPRTSTFLNRPLFSPLGPRTRCSSTRTSAAPMDASGSAMLPRGTFGAMSPTIRVKPLPIPPKHTPPGSVSFSQSAASTVSFLDSPPDPDGFVTNQLMASGALAARPSSRPSSLSPSEHSTQGKYTSSVNQEEASSMAAPAYHYNNDIEATPRPSALVSSRVPQAPPKLTPPQPISFESFNVPWKGMPLEPALWTFNSTELQDIVSRAIRLSAKESFLRLLTIENLDKVLPAELERLDQLKRRTQARYRFLVQRRTMLFHALNTSSVGPRKEEENELLVNKLTAQLSETVMDCDQGLQELFRINDQIAQINKLLDVHASSALAVALRKLNTSYAHRTRDLNKSRQRIFQLEAELEDAWKEAEKFANELDEYEASGADDAVIEKAEIVVVPKSPSQSPPPLTNVDRRGSIPMPMTPTLLEVRTISPLLPRVASPLSHRSTSTSRLEMKFVFPPPIPKDQPNDDAVSIRSSKSVRSIKSTKSTKGYASSLHAAKKRSSRASRSSLRLSIGSGNNHGRGPSEDVPPPLPAIPLQFTNAGQSTSARNGGKSVNLSGNMSTSSSTTALYLYYAAGSRLAHDSSVSLSLPRVKKQASLDTLSNKRTGSAAVEAYQGRAADDLYVESHGRFSALRSSKSAYPGNNADVDLWDDDNEIQTVPRTPPYRSRTNSSPMDNRRSHHTQRSDLPPVPPPKDLQQTLPSAWKHVNDKHKSSRPMQMQMPLTPDSPLPSLPELGVLPQSAPAISPSTHKPGLLRRSKTLHKIKGFTKRYSASIPPIFNGRPTLRKGA